MRPARSPAQAGLTQPHRSLAGRRPLRFATCLALTYLVLCTLYIRASTALAARLAGSVVEMQRVEQAKGIAFVVVSSLIFFVLAYLLMRRISRGETENRQYRQALLTASRRALAGSLASSVAHDMNNLLMVLDADVRQLARDLEEATKDRQEVAQRSIGCVRDLMKLSTRLVSVGNDRTQHRPQVMDVATCVRETLELARVHKRVRRCSIESRVPDALGFVSDPMAIQQMLLNLVLNAADAVGGVGRILVELEEAGDAIRVRVHDDGPGVPPAQRAAIFEAFYTSKETGSGLGLLSVRSCAEMHGGQVRVTDSPLGGACFEITLPSLEREAAKSAQ